MKVEILLTKHKDGICSQVRKIVRNVKGVSRADRMELYAIFFSYRRDSLKPGVLKTVKRQL